MEIGRLFAPYYTAGFAEAPLLHCAQGHRLGSSGVAHWADWGSCSFKNQTENKKKTLSKSLLLGRAVPGTNPVPSPAAIEAMKNAHREELERELEKSQRSQISSVNADIEALRRQYL